MSMDESLPSNDKIISYLDGLMDGDERSDFEARLRQDPQLQQQLEDARIAVEAVRQFGARERVGALHREMMKELQNEKPEGRVINIRRTVRYTMAVAASVLLILVGVQTFNYFHNTPDRLYNDAFVDYSLPLERGVTQNASEIEAEYKKGAYDRIVANANRLRLTARDSFLTAVSFLKTGQTAKAIHWLLAVNPYSPNYQDAQFYLSLAYLKNKNYKKALDLMIGIHDDPNHPYHANISDALIEKVRKLQ
jgi:TolA-binding protein